MKINPCKNCQERYQGCHSKCEAYIKWRKERDEIQDKMHKEQQMRFLIHGKHKVKKK